MARVKGITQIYLPPTRLSTSGMNHPVFIPPAAEHLRTVAGTHFVPRRVGS